MNKQITIQLLILILLSGCSLGLRTYPDIEYSELQPSVVVAIPQKVRYLSRGEENDSGDCPDKESFECMTIYLDPPPLAVKYRILKQAYGPSLPKSIEVATPSHYGLDTYDLKNKIPEIILIGSKGGNYILPRYYRVGALKLSDGRYVVPIYKEDTLWYFPCSISEEIKPVNFGKLEEPYSIPLERITDDERKSKYIKIESNKVLPSHGIFLEDIKTYLDKLSPKIEEFECNRK